MCTYVLCLCVMYLRVFLVCMLVCVRTYLFRRVYVPTTFVSRARNVNVALSSSRENVDRK